MKPEDYPHSVLEEKVRDLDVKIIGVTHNEKFLNKHKSFLEEKIKQSDALLLEGRDQNDLKNNKFFDYVSNFACEQGKRAYQADTITQRTIKIDLAQAVLGYLTFALGWINPAGQILVYTMPLGPFFFLGSHFGKILLQLPYTFHEYDQFLYGETDYRNLMIAEGIDKISSEIKDVKNLTCIHGVAHSKPIKAYLEHPSFRKFKRLLYKPTYELFAETKVREYIPTNHGLEFTRKF